MSEVGLGKKFLFPLKGESGMCGLKRRCLGLAPPHLEGMRGSQVGEKQADAPVCGMLEVEVGCIYF